MREDMHLAPSYLRAQVATGTGAPILAMTASAKVKGGKKHERRDEIEDIKAMCSIKYSKTTVITLSPVLHNHVYVNVKKPPTNVGFYGTEETSSSPQRVGSVHLLWRLYLKQFVSDIKEGRKPKKAMLYVKKYGDLDEIDDFLTSELGHLEIARNPNTCPWVVNSSATGRITAEKIRQRAKEENSSIFLYITTSVMLFGLDIKDVCVVILLSPFYSLNSILQAGGRAGRRQGNNKRKKSVIYNLYNGTDIRLNSPMEQTVREFCSTTSCLKQEMNSNFSSLPLLAQSDGWCCSSCGLC